MSEIKGIDVSANQGNINWKTVANYGMGFAILRITEKGNVIRLLKKIIKDALITKFLLEFINIVMLLLSNRLKQKQI